MDNNKENLEAVVNENSKEEERNSAYNKYVDDITPTTNAVVNVIKAFVTGGAICLVGQIINNTAINQFGLKQDDASGWVTLILIFISIVLTGFGVYSKIGKWGGAGAMVPITGFANSVASPAIEFKVENSVSGVGAKIFTIAGPVIMYGIFSSWVLGLIYWLFKLFAK